MPKQSPVPDDLDRPFWEACNEGRLVIQHCAECNRFQHPPKALCSACGSADSLSWRPVEGVGTIYSYAVVYDTPIEVLKADLPYNMAVITLDSAPGVNMLSQLPGTPVDEVPIGAPVNLTFETTPGNGQMVPEWVVSSSDAQSSSHERAGHAE